MITHEKFKKVNKGGIFCGVVTHVRIKYDRKRLDILISTLFKHNGLKETFEKELKTYMTTEEYLEGK